MPITNDTLKAALLELKLLPARKLAEAARNADAGGEALADFLVERNLLSDDRVGRVLAVLHGLPFVRLGDEVVSREMLRFVPIEMARRASALPFRATEEGLHVALGDPEDLETLSALRKRLGARRLLPHFATRRDLEIAISRLRENSASALQNLVTDAERRLADDPTLLREATASAPFVVRLAETFLRSARQAGASELHLESRGSRAFARLRIDGFLHDLSRHSSRLHELLLARFKIAARLRYDEQHAAQAGRFRTVVKAEPVDVRLSVAPVETGERAVLRFRSERGQHRTLETIGLPAPVRALFETALAAPTGLIAVAGPHGSGRTTTLYAALAALADQRGRVETVEDPIACDLPGVHQIQVDAKAGLTFPSAVRALLQGPAHAVMIGELRDEETAAAAVSAAEGRLVLAGLSADVAKEASMRLTRVAGFERATSARLIIGQRLVRRICPKCVRSVKMDATEARTRLPPVLFRALFGSGKTLEAYRGTGCALCRQSGYRGRIGLFEAITEPGSPERRGRGGASKAKEVRKTDPIMEEDGAEKVRQGLTTVEELLRVLPNRVDMNA